MLWIDSREKWTQPQSTDTHISKWLDRHGIEWEVRKLDIGDYQLSDNPLLTVDRKSSLSELATNLMNRLDSARFWREVRRAHESGVKLVVLCEEGKGIQSINDVPKWKSKYSPVTGRKLIDEMIRLEMAYSVRWVFTDRRHCAEKIIEILTNGGKTYGRKNR